MPYTAFRYISIANAYAGFDGSMLTIRCTAITSYGNADIEVNYNV